MLVPLLSLVLLAQSTPAAMSSPVMSSPEPALPAASGTDALVRNSGSTNARGYVFVIHPDATADVVVDGAVVRKTIGRPQAAWLFAKLQSAGPLADVAGRCMRSTSFGSTTTVAFGGQTTGDLGCGGPVARELIRTIDVIRGELGIATYDPAAGRRPL